MPGANETVQMTTEELRARVPGYERHPAARFTEIQTEDSKAQSLEEKIFLIIGAVLLAALVGMVGWWVLSTWWPG
jgi:hypothetical protein